MLGLLLFEYNTLNLDNKIYQWLNVYYVWNENIKVIIKTNNYN